MTDISAQDVRSRRYGVWLSVGLHGALGAALMLTIEAPELPSASAPSLEVEFLPAPSSPPQPPSPQPLPPATSPRPLQAPPSAALQPQSAIPPDATRPPPPALEPPGLIVASRMLSDKVLADPRSRQGRTLLAQLAPPERFEQRCAVEAMAQIAAWNKSLKPDQVVAYAFAEPVVTGAQLTANGAAVHSDGNWLRLRFSCGLTPDLAKVASFAFRVGDPIPRRDWEAHNLPTGDGPVE